MLTPKKIGNNIPSARTCGNQATMEASTLDLALRTIQELENELEITSKRLKDLETVHASANNEILRLEEKLLTTQNENEELLHDLHGAMDQYEIRSKDVIVLENSVRQLQEENNSFLEELCKLQEGQDRVDQVDERIWQIHESYRKQMADIIEQKNAKDLQTEQLNDQLTSAREHLGKALNDKRMLKRENDKLRDIARKCTACSVVLEAIQKNSAKVSGGLARRCVSSVSLFRPSDGQRRFSSTVDLQSLSTSGVKSANTDASTDKTITKNMKINKAHQSHQNMQRVFSFEAVPILSPSENKKGARVIGTTPKIHHKVSSLEKGKDRHASWPLEYPEAVKEEDDITQITKSRHSGYLDSAIGQKYPRQEEEETVCSEDDIVGLPLTDFENEESDSIKSAKSDNQFLKIAGSSVQLSAQVSRGMLGMTMQPLNELNSLGDSQEYEDAEKSSSFKGLSKEPELHCNRIGHKLFNRVRRKSMEKAN